MKRGEFAVPVAPSARSPISPDYPCRFEEIPFHAPVSFSPCWWCRRAGADANAFRKLIEDIISWVERTPDPGGRCRRVVRRCAAAGRCRTRGAAPSVADR